MLKVSLIIALVLTSFGGAAEQPNIVFILADDMGFDSVSANNPAIGGMKTPNIDDLISQGMNFTDAHSGSAVCTPTRYGLLTGRHCWRSRLKRSVLWEYGRPLIEKDRQTVSSFLSENGYQTGMIGKWHLGLHWHDKDGNVANDINEDADSYFNAGEQRIATVSAKIDFSQAVSGGPTAIGFDYWFGMDAPNFPPYTWIENETVLGHLVTTKPEKIFGHPGPMVEGWKLEDILPTLGKKSAEYIIKASKKDQPFFLYVPLTSPHTPISPSADWKGKSGITHYADFVMETDAIVGQIMNAIENAGNANNTIVIFSADNGTSSYGRQIAELKSHGVDINQHFRGHKTQIHEGGHRVPFVVRWPGITPAGTTSNQVICLTDFFATVADILGQQLPEDSGEDSYSILPLLTGKADALPNRNLVINHDLGGNFAIRKDEWKLVPKDKTVALYNLSVDPKETTDLSRDYPEIVQELTNTLETYKTQGRSR
ncbi:MAG: arylsulfatase [Verrucomicrobiales bacterium]|nr:arylsulfatase [Verrucomicrobiales bacterium]